MRLKTKLVLAITLLVLLIGGLLSLVYVSELLHAAVRQSYDTNRMVANQVRFALQNALEAGLKDREVDPNNPAQLRNLEAEAVRNNAPLQAVVDSVNRYSLTVYDINIGDKQSTTLLSTNPENEDKPLPLRPDYQQLLHANPIQFMKEVFGPPKVFDVVVPLERNGELFATVHVGVRTTLLRAVYAPWLAAALTLMELVLGAALIAAFLSEQPGAPAPGRDQPAARLLDRRRRQRGGRPARSIPRARIPRRRSPTRSRSSATACATWKRSFPP